ncbi:TadE/TadG family type IV pilus assembly protein [Rhodalgimonas zhirmunskyi]|uniref:Flp pilus assembly protein TadG n=1 Tax=Rhodalgimonas zhirmunskyi TaxID=2964767 RepID=A0AAJ1U8V2_9RHOB|nr:hypothetical protein [Rhodoalgimonas zhirmunskyi]MDQ2093268.1 hypothetical protein [Rhodoalgimonas zhirmunskyi]
MLNYIPLPYRIRKRLSGFRDETDGTVAVEAVVMLPLILWAFCGLFVFFDAYRQNAISQKAAYTISDLISRETAAIDNDYIDGMYSMLNFLTRSGQERRLRITIVRFDADDGEYHVEWSETRGTMDPLDDAVVNGWTDTLPVMVDEERLILVETRTVYEPPFTVGLSQQTLQTFVFTRPRFAPQVLFDASA